MLASCIPLSQLLWLPGRLWALGMDSEIPVGFVGLITHGKGMTSISLDFLGTCLQLERLCPWVTLQHREAAGRGLVLGREVQPRRTQAAGPRTRSWDSSFMKLGSGSSSKVIMEAACPGLFFDLLCLGFPHLSQSKGDLGLGGTATL